MKGGDSKWPKKSKSEVFREGPTQDPLAADGKEPPKEVRGRKVAAVAAVVAVDPPKELPLPEGTEASRRLCEEISRISGGTCFLGFSRGKDSIAAWLYLRKFFKRIIPFHCASIPHLSFVDQSLDYYEKIFETKIIRCLSGEITTYISNLVFQPGEDEDAIDSLELWKYDNHDIAKALQKQYGSGIWCAFGINLTDSLDRRIYVTKSQGRNENWMTFYPTFDWTRSQVQGAIKSAGIRLPGDYRLANRSLAGLPNFRHLYRMEEVFPEDMEMIETWFPFIRAQLARNEFRAERQKARKERKKSAEQNSDKSTA